MKVSMRWICSAEGMYGSGCNTFETHRAAVLRAGYKVIPYDDLTQGERYQAAGHSSGMHLPVVIETLADAPISSRRGEGGFPAGSRFALDVEIEPDRGEE